MTQDSTQCFRQEAQDLFEQLESALLDLEQAPDNRDQIDSAFRALHTIKGSGSMFGFDVLAAFAHHLETAFDQVRNGKIAASPELIGLALAAKDHMRGLMDAVAGTPDPDGEQLIARLGTAMGGRPAVAAVPKPAAQQSKVQDETEAEAATYRIRFRLAPDALRRGVNPLLLLDELRTLGSCTVVGLTEAIPPLEDMESDGCYMAWDVVLTTTVPRSIIDDVFIFVIDDMELQVQRVADGESGSRLGEILVNRGDVKPDNIAAALSQVPRLGDLLVADGTISGGVLKSALAEQQHLRQEVAPAAPAKVSESIRIQAQHLDDLMDRVGELVIAQARLKQLAVAGGDSHLKSVAEEIERLSNELRDTTMEIRMVPIGSLFGRFRRLIRDLSGELGKTITLSTSGEDTELDKTVIERLNDPLLHLVRNAIDHGIEEPERREAAGKPREGEVHLSAVHSGAQVLITIRDDGRGLDRARIRARAEEHGLIVPGAKISDSDLFQCIFQPGFSTASQVTNLSGRGVGMDVVKRTIESLRGAVDVTSVPGQGSEITLRLPLTLAIIDGLLVRVGDGRYVIPLAAVEECVELSAAEDVRSKGRSFLNLRGDLVPFLRLREMFGVSTPVEPFPKAVIVSTGDLRVGLVVDQVIGDHQTVIKSLSKLHADVECFSGATILGDGTVALIMDIAHLVDAGQQPLPYREAS